MRTVTHCICKKRLAVQRIMRLSVAQSFFIVATSFVFDKIHVFNIFYSLIIYDQIYNLLTKLCYICLCYSFLAFCVSCRSFFFNVAKTC